MLYSMTGFGRAEASVNSKQIVVELKSLNGKQFEMMTKLPPILRSYELDIRNLLNSTLFRGTIDLTVTIKQEGASKPMAVNTELAVFYYQSMRQIADRLDLPQENVLSTLMRMPEVVAAEQDMLPEDEWEVVRKAIADAAASLMAHRQHEGEALYNDLRSRIKNIENLLGEIIPHEAARAEKVRARINQSMNEFLSKDKIDQNRFEQEMIYYLERMDFSEEKTRLAQHCKYFYTTVAKEDLAKGKMIGFIMQEIGREINTLGAKANDATIQQIVINMKDELEKAKEQVLNIL
ncbi:MAG: YicC family protein [Chitinophagaceae bacterium]|nr:YicC family protein [Chitinophagaceae bacterium]